MRWASAVDLDSSLPAAVDRAAAKIFLDLGRQEPDLLIAFVSAHHAPRFDALVELIRREFEGAFISGSVKTTWGTAA